MAPSKLEVSNREDNSLVLDPLHDFHFCIDCGTGVGDPWDPIRFRAHFEKCLEEYYTYSKFS